MNRTQSFSRDLCDVAAVAFIFKLEDVEESSFSSDDELDFVNVAHLKNKKEEGVS